MIFANNLKFVKAVMKLSGKVHDSVKDTILETRKVENIGQLKNCEKLIGYKIFTGCG